MLVDNSGERPSKSYKDDDFCIATRNVLRLYRAGMLKEVAAELEKYRIYIAGFQEIQMEGKWSARYRELHIDV